MTQRRLPAGFNSADENDLVQKGPGGLWYSRGPAEVVAPRDFVSLFNTGGITTRRAPDVTIVVDTADVAWTESDVISLTPVANAVSGDTVTVKDTGGQADLKGIRVQSTGGTVEGAAEYILREPWGATTFVYRGGSLWTLAASGSRANPELIRRQQALSTLRVQPVELGTVSFAGTSTIGACSDGLGGILVASSNDVGTVYGPGVVDVKASLVGITECSQLVRGGVSNNVIIARGAGSTNVSRSTNRGASWASVATTLGGAVAGATWNGTRFVVCAGSTVASSTDAVAFAAGSTAGAPGTYQGLASLASGVIVAHISEQGFARSTNNGSTWAPAGSIAGYDGTKSGILAGDGSTEVFFLLENTSTTDLWVSSDGITWTLRFTFAFASLFQPGLFICQDTGVMFALILSSPMVAALSYDRGFSWTTSYYPNEGGLPGDKAGIADGRVIWMYNQKLYASV